MYLATFLFRNQKGKKQRIEVDKMVQEEGAEKVYREFFFHS